MAWILNEITSLSPDVYPSTLTESNVLCYSASENYTCSYLGLLVFREMEK